MNAGELKPIDRLSEIEALTAFERRAPGSYAERRVAGHLRSRLEELGRVAEIEELDAWPGWPLAFAIHAAMAVAGSVLSVSARYPGRRSCSPPPC